jgi:hypothetical protein
MKIKPVLRVHCQCTFLRQILYQSQSCVDFHFEFANNFIDKSGIQKNPITNLYFFSDPDTRMRNAGQLTR